MEWLAEEDSKTKIEDEKRTENGGDDTELLPNLKNIDEPSWRGSQYLKVCKVKTLVVPILLRKSST